MYDDSEKYKLITNSSKWRMPWTIVYQYQNEYGFKYTYVVFVSCSVKLQNIL